MSRMRSCETEGTSETTHVCYQRRLLLIADMPIVKTRDKKSSSALTTTAIAITIAVTTIVKGQWPANMLANCFARCSEASWNMPFSMTPKNVTASMYRPNVSSGWNPCSSRS